MLTNIWVIIIAVFLTLSYFFPPFQAGTLTLSAVAVAGAIGLFIRRTQRTGVANAKLKPRQRSAQSRAAAPAKAKSAKAAKPWKLGTVLIGLWSLVEVVFWAIVVAFLLSVWQPGWFTALTDRIQMRIAGVAIEPGHEAEWNLTTVAGKAYAGRRSTASLVPPSVYSWRDNKLVIVAEAEQGRYFKLEGNCRPWAGAGPWILACNGRWGEVRSPRDPILHPATSGEASSNWDHGTFSAEFFTGATEGQVTFTQEVGAAAVPGFLKFRLVKGK